MANKNNIQYDIPMLDNLNKRVMSKWENLFQSFGILEYNISSYRVQTCCPIHGGDNPSALDMYLEGCNTFPGLWYCHTHQCHTIFPKNIIGFTQGMLSRHLGWNSPNDKKVKFMEAVNYLVKFLNTSPSELQDDNFNYHSHNFTKQINNIFTNSVKPISEISRQKVRENLAIPSSYFVKRGFSELILSSYDIGDCVNPAKFMYNRAVVPIYDKDYNYVGCTGRTICNKKPKWLHSDGFQGTQHLYNYCNAKKYIEQSKTAIIVEGPSDCWRLEECGLHNSLALLGVSLSTGQFNLLNQSGALSLIIILDNDKNKAGDIAMKKLYEQCHRLYRMYFPQIKTNDVGEMQNDEVTSDILPYIKKLEKEMM